MDNSNYVSLYKDDQLAQTVNRFMIVPAAALTGPEHKMEHPAATPPAWAKMLIASLLVSDG